MDGVCRTEPAREDFISESRNAKSNCLNCPVREDCLGYAILYDEQGVWGGTTYEEREFFIVSNPHLVQSLRQEAMELGILEHRYYAARYFENLTVARSLSQKTPHVVEPQISLADALQFVEELLEPLVGSNTQLGFVL